MLTVGEALREAQASMSGDELRALTRQRRQLTAAVTHQARRLAADEGLKVTQAVADQVEATLTAAMVDEECGKAVRSGLLVAALAATGVDEVELAKAVAVPEAHRASRATARGAEPAAPPDLHVVPDPDADEKALAAAQERLDAAEEALAEVQEAYDEAAAEVEKLEARSMQVQAEIDELKRKLAELEETYEEIDDELGDAEDTKAEARTPYATATAKERDAAAKATLEQALGSATGPALGALDGVDPARVRGVGRLAVAGGLEARGRAARSRGGRRWSPTRRCRGRRGTPRRGRWSRPARAARRVRRSGRPGSGRAGRWRRRRRRPAARRASAGIVSSTSRTSNAIASSVARTMWARVVPRVRPMIRPRACGSQCGAPRPVSAGTKTTPSEDGAVAAIASVSAAEPTICSPSRSHCTAAPVTKIAPSSA